MQKEGVETCEWIPAWLKINPVIYDLSKSAFRADATCRGQITEIADEYCIGRMPGRGVLSNSGSSTRRLHLHPPHGKQVEPSLWSRW